MENTIYIGHQLFLKEKPFYLEFKQLKEYYNFRRKFKADKKRKQ